MTITADRAHDELIGVLRDPEFVANALELIRTADQMCAEDHDLTNLVAARFADIGGGFADVYALARHLESMVSYRERLYQMRTAS